MANRRKFIGSMASISVISGVNSVAASDELGSTRLSDEEISEKIQKAFKVNGNEGIRQVADKYDLTYELATGTRTSEEDDESDFSTEDRYSESNSEFSILLNPVSGDEDQVRFTIQMRLDTVRNRFREAREVDDIIGVSYDDDHWSIVGSPNVAATETHEADWYPDPLEGGGSGLAGVVDIEHNWDINDGGLPESALVSLEVVFENLDGVKTPLWGKYEHTRAVRSTGSITGIEAEAELGPLSVSLSTSASTAWYDADNVDASGIID